VCSAAPAFEASGPQAVYNTSIHLYLLANIVTMTSHGKELGPPSKKGKYQFSPFSK